MRKKNNLYIAFGESKTLKEWSKDSRCKVSYGTLIKRNVDYKWSLEKSLTKTCHAYGRSDLIGKKYGRLIVISFNRLSKRQQTIWNCKCDCGNDRVLSISQLISGHTRSCGCFKRDEMRKRGKLTTIGYGLAARNRVLLEKKTMAKKRKIQWDITDDRFYELCKSNCYYCGESPSMIRKCNGFNGTFTYNGIDRIDSNKGYEEDNVVSCCKYCNYAKNILTQTEFYNFIKKLYESLKIKKYIL